MIIDTIIPATQIVAGYGCRIDGIDYTASVGPDWSITHDSEAAFASASVQVLRPFGLSRGRHTIALYAGWQGDTSQPGFVGEITLKADAFYPRRSTLQAGGYLKRTEVGLDLAKAFYYDGGTEEETAATLALIPPGYEAIPIQTDAVGIIHILETYGISPETTGHSIEASWWIPAKIEPVLWDIGKSGWSIIQEWDRIADYRTADGRLGQVLRRQLYGQVPSGARHTFVQGVDILDLQASTEFQVYNQVRVTGAPVPSDPDDPAIDDEGIVLGIAPPGTPAPSDYIPTPPGVRTDDSLSSNYIETFDDAEEIADRRLQRLKEPLQDLSLTTFGCPELDIGDGVGINAPAMGINTIGFVVAHTMTGQPLRTQLSVRASVEGTGIRPNQPPLPQMLISVVLEHVLVAGSPTALAMITVDARASSDPDGSVAAYAITIDGVTYDLPYITHATTSPSPVAVTLVVTDDLGLSATLTQQATWNPATALVEPLTLAELTQGEATADGEQTWNSLAAPVTAVAPIALGGSILLGCDNGDLYRSIDMLATAATMVQNLGARINCLWNNEVVTERWLAGLDNGDVWLSIDDGLTWTKQATLADAINDISESPYQVNQATCAVGTGIFQTWDLITWSLLYNHTAEALRFAAGLYAGVSTVYSSHADGRIVRYRNEPASIDIVGLLPDGNARGLTLAIDRELLYALTDTEEGKSYSMTPDGTFTPGPELGTACSHAIRSGAGDWVYAACDGALKKVLFTQGTTYDVRVMTSPQRALAVGYGSLGRPTLPPVIVGYEILRATDHNAAAGEAGIWHLSADGVWTLHNIPAMAGELIYGIAASPLAPDSWIVGAKSGKLWITLDAGTTWTMVELFNTRLAPYSIGWSETTATRWWAIGGEGGGPSGDDFEDGAKPKLYRGLGTAQDDEVQITTNANPFHVRACAGLDEDVVYTYTKTAMRYQLGWESMEGGGGGYEPNPAITFTHAIENVRGTTRVFLGSGYGSEDYRTEDAHSLSPDGDSLSVSLTHTYMGMRQGLDVGVIPAIGATDGPGYVHVDIPPAMVIDDGSGQVRADRQTRTVVAAVIMGSALATRDAYCMIGDTWQRVPGPEGVTSTWTNHIEIINRTGSE